jgi:hypothetical protein
MSVSCLLQGKGAKNGMVTFLNVCGYKNCEENLPFLKIRILKFLIVQ